MGSESRTGWGTHTNRNTPNDNNDNNQRHGFYNAPMGSEGRTGWGTHTNRNTPNDNSDNNQRNRSNNALNGRDAQISRCNTLAALVAVWKELPPSRLVEKWTQTVGTTVRYQQQVREVLDVLGDFTPLHREDALAVFGTFVAKPPVPHQVEAYNACRSDIIHAMLTARNALDYTTQTRTLVEHVAVILAAHLETQPINGIDMENILAFVRHSRRHYDDSGESMSETLRTLERRTEQWDKERRDRARTLSRDNDRDIVGMPGPDDANHYTRSPILPQDQELVASQARENIARRLPKVIVDAEVPSLEWHLQTHFWLLREDFMLSLCRGVHYHSELLHGRKPRDKCRDVRRYELDSLGATVNEMDGLLFDFRIHNFTEAKKRVRFNFGKRLMDGNYVVVTTLDGGFEVGTLHTGTVVRHRPPPRGRDGSRDRISNYDWGDPIQWGQFCIRFDTDFMKACKAGQRYVMVESSVFFLPYQRVLSSLKTIREDTVRAPIREALCTGRTVVPEYIAARPVLDLRGIVSFQPSVRSREINVTEDAVWEEALPWSAEVESNRPSDTEHVLEPAQVDGLKCMLRNNVAILQGTPGTGKSFMGVKLVQILLRNFPRENIVLVALTNHAVDSVLFDCLKFTSNIVRVGSRSESPQIAEMQLSRKMRNVGPHREMGDIVWSINKLKKDLEGVRATHVEAWERHLDDEDTSPALVALLNFFLERRNPIATQRRAKEQEYHKIEEAISRVVDRHNAERNRKLTPQSVAEQIQRSQTEATNCIAQSDGIAASVRVLRHDVVGHYEEEDIMKVLWIVREQVEVWEDYTQDPDTAQDALEATQLLKDHETRCLEIIAQGKRSTELHTRAMELRRHAEELRNILPEVEALCRLEDEIQDLRRREECISFEAWRVERGRAMIAEQGAHNAADAVLPEDDMENDSGDDDVERAMAQAEQDARDVAVEEDEGREEVHVEAGGNDAERAQARVRCEDLLRRGAHNLNADERETVVHLARAEFEAVVLKKIRTLCERAEKHREAMESRQTDAILRVLTEHSIIGATTTGVARILPALRKLKPKIMIVEEAAEVLESHVLACLTQDVEHLILIGDDRQLRPKVQEHVLEVRKNMEVSLLERLVRLNCPHVTLNIQRRMHPEISAFTKAYYANPSSSRPWCRPVRIEDHPATVTRQVVHGVRDSARVVFVAHDHREGFNESLQSPHNVFEAKLCVVIARYLALQDGVELNQIVILVPYTGQLMNVFEEARQMQLPYITKDRRDGVRICTVDNFQGEENDVVILSLVRTDKPGFLAIENRACVSLSRARRGMYIIGCPRVLSEANELWRTALSLCEERGTVCRLDFPASCPHGTPLNFRDAATYRAKVGAGGGCFRTCGATLACGHTCTKMCHGKDLAHATTKCTARCSRTGSACDPPHDCEHACVHQCWEPCGPCVVTVPVPCHACGNSTNVQCGKRAELLCHHIVTMDNPLCGHTMSGKCHLWRTDRGQHSLRANCREKCGTIMKCGHQCTRTCHEDDPDHSNLKCNHSVTEVRKCGHEGTYPCWQWTSDNLPPCQKTCAAAMPCGHRCTSKCDTCTTEGVHCQCRERVTKVESECGHANVVECWEKEKVMCLSRCGVPLRCGHACEGRCGDCRRPNAMGWLRHGVCKKKCKRALPCGHACKANCAKDCPPCTESCRRRCPHSNCARKKKHPCGECKIECKMPCQWSCEHHACALTCSEACTRGPCDERCAKTLACGHRCSGICGEVCPSFCFDCCHAATDRTSYAATHHLKCFLHVSAEEFLETIFGPEREQPPLLLQLDDCNCTFLVHELDSAVRAQQYEDEETNTERMKKYTCPACRTPIEYCGRYSTLLKSRERDLRAVNRIIREKQSNRTMATRNVVDSGLKVLASLLPETDVSLRADVESGRVFQSAISPFNKAEPKKPLPKMGKKYGMKDHAAAMGVFKVLQDQFIKEERDHKNKLQEERRAQAEQLVHIFNGHPAHWKRFAQCLCQFLSTLHNTTCSEEDLMLWQRTIQTMAMLLELSRRREQLVRAVGLPPDGDVEAYLCSTLDQLFPSDGTTHDNDEVQRVQWDVEIYTLMHRFIGARHLIRRLPGGGAQTQDTTLVEGAIAQLSMVRRDPTSTESQRVLNQLRKDVQVIERTYNIAEWGTRTLVLQAAKAIGLSASNVFKCPNGHFYFVGECGGAMQMGVCPDCNATVGGQDHALVAGNAYAGNEVQSGARPLFGYHLGFAPGQAPRH